MARISQTISAPARTGALAARLAIDFWMMLLLMATMFFGDWLVLHPPAGITTPAWWLLDSPVHGLVALIVLAPFLLRQTSLVKAFGLAMLAGGAAVLIDFDHAIAARSMSLYAITHLSERPVTHGLAFALICGLAAWLISKRPAAGWFLFAALASHFIRDASYAEVAYMLWPVAPFHGLLPAFNYYGLEICLYLVSTVVAGRAWNHEPHEIHKRERREEEMG